MTDRADPLGAAAVAGLPPAARLALDADPVPTAAPPPLAGLLFAPLPPFALPPVAAADLPPRELHALSASGGPDLCLIDCPPGTDRPAFAAAAALEAVRRGERVAVVTGSPADADAVHARLLDADVVVGRATGPNEPPDPDHGAAAHARPAADARRRLLDHLDRRREEAAAARAAAAALPHLTELAAELGRHGASIDAVKADPLAEPDDARDAALAALDAAHAADRAKLLAKPGGLFGAMKGLFAKGEADKLDRCDADHRAARAAAVADHAARRLADLQRQQAEGLDRFRAAGRAVTGVGLPAPGPAGLDATTAAVERAVADAAEAVGRAEADVQRFDARRPAVERALCRLVPAAVGPVAALSDPLLTSADRVIVVAADHLDDAALTAAAGVAPRRVLLGTAGNRRPGPALFRRLWDRFAPPERWALAGTRLVAVLRPHDPTACHGEPLADRPDVGLWFTPANDLAAVVFPPTCPLAEAKALVAAELGLVTLAGCGPVAWHDDPDRLEACWPAVDPADGDWVELGDGVRERVCGTGPDGLTAAVAFDRTRWTRPAAERWLAAHLPPARAVRLPAPVLVAS